MKLRIYKTNKDFYIIQKRIFKFLFIEWWIGYSSKYGNIFKTVDEARDEILAALSKLQNQGQI